MLRYIKISQWSYFGVPIAYGVQVLYLLYSLIIIIPGTTENLLISEFSEIRPCSLSSDISPLRFQLC